jgi:hypothetical protein
VASFTDNAQRPWTIRVASAGIKKIRAALAFDLADLSGKAEQRLEEDPALLVDCLWLLVEEDARGRNVSAVEFGEALVGDAIDFATVALLEAKADFFPSRKRQILRRIAEKTAKVREKADALALAKIEDPTLEEAMEKAIADRMTRDLETALTRLRSATD